MKIKWENKLEESLVSDFIIIKMKHHVLKVLRRRWHLVQPASVVY